jgi:hypothetical protein
MLKILVISISYYLTLPRVNFNVLKITPAFFVNTGFSAAIILRIKRKQTL